MIKVGEEIAIEVTGQEKLSSTSLSITSFLLFPVEINYDMDRFAPKLMM
jgi:hypothetical protein